MKHVVVKMRKINNVAGNIKYLSDTKEHPDTCITYSTCSEEQWLDYAAANQKEFEASGKAGTGKCVEAREAVLVLPNTFYRLDQKSREHYAKYIAHKFKDKHGVEVMTALHGADKDRNNMHIHLMYMERTRVEAHEKIADRRLYFDDRGRQVKSKKYATDEAGNLLPGYSFVRKGETYGGTKEWTSKNQHLHSNEFTHQLKVWWANEINQIRELDWAKDMEEVAVYDRNKSPYLPMQNIPQPLKYSDKEKQEESNKAQEEYVKHIIECNQLRKEYNNQVDVALKNGADPEKLTTYRKQLSKEIYKNTKKDHSETHRMLYKALNWINRVIDRLKELKSILAPSEELTDTNKKKISLSESIEKAKTRVNNNRKHTREGPGR